MLGCALAASCCVVRRAGRKEAEATERVAHILTFRAIGSVSSVAIVFIKRLVAVLV